MRRVFLLAILLLTAGCSDTNNLPQVSPLERCPDVPLIHTGEATYYTFASGAGACMFDSPPGNLMIGAMNQHDYQESRIWGECDHPRARPVSSL